MHRERDSGYWQKLRSRPMAQKPQTLELLNLIHTTPLAVSLLKRLFMMPLLVKAIRLMTRIQRHSAGAHNESEKVLTTSVTRIM